MLTFIKQVIAAEPLGTGLVGTGPFQDVTTETAVRDQTGFFLSALVGTITVVGGLAFVIYFFLGALKWITAGGDKGKTADAQSSMTQAAIGLIALVASYFVVGIVGGVLGLDILNPLSTLIP